tara:strand:- start:2844 stop:3542 length:699 start_codon:yes stop_codon:yes gene_type:complete
MVTSIHQPNYIPWLGFFHKVLLSDTYVVFDDVQFPRGKDFANRNQIKTNNGTLWLTATVLRKEDLKPWNQVEINNNGWIEKHLVNLEAFYKKTTYYKDYYPALNEIYLKKHNLLIDLNLDLIKYFLTVLDKKVDIVLSSSIPTELKGMDKILHILKTLNTTEYVSGDGEGSKRYIDEDLFKQSNIELVWQNYKHPTYKQQFGEFSPYMSIVDLIFNEGPNSKDIILHNNQPS